MFCPHVSNMKLGITSGSLTKISGGTKKEIDLNKTQTKCYWSYSQQGGSVVVPQSPGGRVLAAHISTHSSYVQGWSGPLAICNQKI